MSEFSNTLSYFIKSRNISVSALVKYCELDRSTMYKFINGKRNPASRMLVEKLAEYMNLNPVETTALLEAYQLTEVGEEAYYSRKGVLDFVLSIGDLRFQFTPESYPNKFIDISSDSNLSPADCTPLSGRLAVSSAIHMILQAEASRKDGVVFLFAQPEHLQMLDIAASLSWLDQSIRIDHILCIDNSQNLVKSQRNYNLNCLLKILPFFGTRHQYRPFYYYDNVNSHFNNLNFMPCAFITFDAAVICSSDTQKGILFHQSESIALLKEAYISMLSSVRPLMTAFTPSPLNFHLKYFSKEFRNVPDHYTLQAVPCIIPYFTRELADKYVPANFPNRLEFLQNLQQYIKEFPMKKFHTYFTRKGLQAFLRTGYVSEIPSYICSKIEFPDRIYLLQKLVNAAENGTDIRMLKGKLENFPANFYLSISGPSGYFMLTNSPEQSPAYFFLKEQKLLHAFHDFAESLEQGEFLLSLDDTKRIVQEEIKRAIALKN